MCCGEVSCAEQRETATGRFGPKYLESDCLAALQMPALGRTFLPKVDFFHADTETRRSWLWTSSHLLGRFDAAQSRIASVGGHRWGITSPSRTDCGVMCEARPRRTRPVSQIGLQNGHCADRPRRHGLLKRRRGGSKSPRTIGNTAAVSYPVVHSSGTVVALDGRRKGKQRLPRGGRRVLCVGGTDPGSAAARGALELPVVRESEVWGLRPVSWTAPLLESKASLPIGVSTLAAPGLTH